MRLLVLCILANLAFVSCEVYFSETFLGGNPLDRWIESDKTSDDQGKFEISAGLKPSDKTAKGLRTTQDARFYAISTKFDKPFSNKDKNLVIQFTVKHEQDIDCGGGYLKILGSDFEASKFNGETPYKIMFGPDICGISTKKVHVIINYKGENHLLKPEIKCKDDTLTHLYTLIITPQNKYTVLIDNAVEHEGTLEEDWDMLPPKTIPDESVKKPSDWVDEQEIVDPNDKKPDDWDKPKSIPDANAKKPDDWDDEMDGEWEPPHVDNPEYKGEWTPKKIPNPDYKGPWEQPNIPNPSYKPDNELYKFDDIGGIGFDLWQVKSGSIFSNILITDDIEKAKENGELMWKPTYEAEKDQKEKDAEAKAMEDKTPEEDLKDEPAAKSEHDEL